MLLLLSQMQLTTLFLLTVSISADVNPGHKNEYVGLKFGTEVEDHVLLELDVHPFKEAFSICSWIKRLPHSAIYPYWFGYGTPSVAYEIMMRDDGIYWIFNKRSDFQSGVTRPDGKWRHHCVTWAASSNKFDVYYEGSLIGTVATPSGRNVGLSGKIALGNLGTTDGRVTRADTVFGGEMTKLNIFTKALNQTEVREMSDAGLCSDFEDQYGLDRYVRWEDLMRAKRSGNVTEIDVGCRGEEIHPIWDVLYDKVYYNKVLTKDLLNTLRSSWDQLEHFVGSTISEGFIKYFKYDGHDTQNRCDED